MTSYKLRSILALVFFFLLSNGSLAERWDRHYSFLSIGLGEVGWTNSEVYHGDKLLLDGRYVFSQEQDNSNPLFERTDSKHLIEGHLQWGGEDTKREYTMLTYTAAATKWDYALKPGDFQTTRDTVSWGEVMLSDDKTLGINYYREILIGKVGRSWAYVANNGFQYGFSLQGAGGLAWSESDAANYGEVVNPVIGAWQHFFMKFNKYGMIYGDLETVAGIRFKEPKSTNSRRALARMGYRLNFGNTYTIETFLEKRTYLYDSFYTANLYTKARRVGINFSYKL